MGMDLNTDLDKFYYLSFFFVHLHIKLSNPVHQLVFIIPFSNSNSINALISNKRKEGS